MKFVCTLIFCIISFQAISQVNNFKMMIGYSESQIKQEVRGFDSTKEAYSEGGKTIFYYYPDFFVLYSIKANKKCNKVWISFNSIALTSSMNEWFYDNNYISKKDTRTGEYEWTKNIIIKSDRKGIPVDEQIVSVVKINSKTFFFANKLATLLGY